MNHLYLEEVDIDKITGDYVKKRRLTKEERDKLHQKNREEMKEMKKQMAFGRRKKSGASKTNFENKKNKPYAMVRNKALRKQKRPAGLKLKLKEKHMQKMASQKLEHH